MRVCERCNTELADEMEACEKCGERIESAKSPDGKAKADAADVLARLVYALIGVVRCYWPMLLAGTLFIAMQWVFPFNDWWRTWEKPHSYYSHGPLVPLISLFMVWANRKRLAQVKIQPETTQPSLLASKRLK